MEKINTPDIENESATEKVEAERKLLDQLNKARQGQIEVEDIYSFVFNGHSTKGTEYPDFLKGREDLLQKFDVGKGEGNYKSSRTAAHDMVEYLVEEAEDVIREFEEKAHIERINKEIDTEISFLDQLNKARQGQIEFSDIYSHVFGQGSKSGVDYPAFLVNRADLLEKFAVGKNGEPYTSTTEASHDLVEFLVEETEDVLNDLEEQLAKFDKKEKIVTKKPVSSKKETKHDEPTVTPPQTENTTQQAENVSEPEKTNIEANIPTEDEAGTNKEVIESPEVKGILRTINKLTAKFPKLYRLLMATELVVVLSAAKGDLHPTDHTKITQEYVDHNKDIELTPQKIQDEFEKLKSEMPHFIIEMIDTLSSVKNPEDRAKLIESAKTVNISGFEKFILSNDQMQSLIDTMPQAFTHNINEITYVDNTPNLSSKYGISSSENLEGKSAANANYETRKIVVYRTSENASLQWIVNNMLGHEMFHLEDWKSNRLLTKNERIDLLASVIERVKSPDRYKSDYVEKINNPDKKMELELKAGEYFAEIGGVYISGEYATLPKADKDIIKNLFKKISPEFKRGDSLKMRDEIIGFKLDIYGEEITDEQIEKEGRENGESSWPEVERNMKEILGDSFTEPRISEEKAKWINDSIESWKNTIKESINRQKKERDATLNIRYKN